MPWVPTNNDGSRAGHEVIRVVLQTRMVGSQLPRWVLDASKRDHAAPRNVQPTSKPTSLGCVLTTIMVKVLFLTSK